MKIEYYMQLMYKPSLLEKLQHFCNAVCPPFSSLYLYFIFILRLNFCLFFLVVYRRLSPCWRIVHLSYVYKVRILLMVELPGFWRSSQSLSLSLNFYPLFFFPFRFHLPTSIAIYRGVVSFNIPFLLLIILAMEDNIIIL